MPRTQSSRYNSNVVIPSEVEGPRRATFKVTSAGSFGFASVSLAMTGWRMRYFRQNPPAYKRIRGGLDCAYIFSMSDKPSKLKIADREFTSRLVVGTGKF